VQRYQSVTICCFNSIPPNYNVSRTGYNEVDLTDNKASNTKIDFFSSLHLNDVEVIGKFGFGNAVYQGANRYYLNNFMQQHKLEIKGKTFHKRLHHSEDGGNSYDMLFTGILIEFGKMIKLGLGSMQLPCYSCFKMGQLQKMPILQEMLLIRVD
jgi:hypothetical protein